ncbi:MAG: ATP-dependent Clp protease adaptor ClpS [Bacteroidetes bacterium]|nr:ATP-dependent Clp protease adaptor ClpS [Bacteroidota bacterium]
MSFFFNHQTETFTEVLVEEQIVPLKDLVIYNDDFNTFQHVIISLCDICDHDPIQAEQCAHIIHNKGKCGVKRGAIEDLKSMCLALLDRGLSAKIE